MDGWMGRKEVLGVGGYKCLPEHHLPTYPVRVGRRAAATTPTQPSLGSLRGWQLRHAFAASFTNSITPLNFLCTKGLLLDGPSPAFQMPHGVKPPPSGRFPEIILGETNWLSYRLPWGNEKCLVEI